MNLGDRRVVVPSLTPACCHRFTGVLPSEFAKLTKLGWLGLDQLDLQGPIPAALCELTQCLNGTCPMTLQANCTESSALNCTGCCVAVSSGLDDDTYQACVQY